MLFPEDFLRSMGYGGVATVAVDMLAALTVLPALLAVLGPKVNALRIRRSLQPCTAVGTSQRGLVPAGAQRHAQARRLRHRDRDRAAGPGRAVPAHLLGRHGRQDAARRLDGRQVSQALDSQFPVNSTAPIEALVTGARAPAAAHRLPAPIDAIPGVTGAQVTGTATPRSTSAQPAGVLAQAIVQMRPTQQGRAGRDHGRDELASLGATLPWMALLTGVARSCCCSGVRLGGAAAKAITSLALLLIIVVGAFSASGITFIKLMGVGMIVALLVDATIIRVLLVPATMRLLGRTNWWAPRPLRRLYARYGIKEEIEAERAGVPV